MAKSDQLSARLQVCKLEVRALVGGSWLAALIGQDPCQSF